mgnify:CR=1 FL=1
MASLVSIAMNFFERYNKMYRVLHIKMSVFKHCSWANRFSVRAQTLHEGRILWSILFDTKSKDGTYLLIKKINKNDFGLWETTGDFGRPWPTWNGGATCGTQNDTLNAEQNAAEDQQPLFVDSLGLL